MSMNKGPCDRLQSDPALKECTPENPVKPAPTYLPRKNAAVNTDKNPEDTLGEVIENLNRRLAKNHRCLLKPKL